MMKLRGMIDRFDTVPRKSHSILLNIYWNTYLFLKTEKKKQKKNWHSMCNMAQMDLIILVNALFHSS